MKNELYLEVMTQFKLIIFLDLKILLERFGYYKTCFVVFRETFSSLNKPKHPVNYLFFFIHLFKTVFNCIFISSSKVNIHRILEIMSTFSKNKIYLQKKRFM